MTIRESKLIGPLYTYVLFFFSFPLSTTVVIRQTPTFAVTLQISTMPPIISIIIIALATLRPLPSPPESNQIKATRCTPLPGGW